MGYIKIKFNKEFPGDEQVKDWANTLSCFRLPELLIEKDEENNVLIISFDEVLFKLSLAFRSFFEKLENIWITGFSTNNNSETFIYDFDGRNELELTVTKYLEIRRHWRILTSLGFKREYVRFSFGENKNVKTILDYRLSDEYLDSVMAEELNSL